ncbi:phosphocholine cytidylyltransferase family protein [Candidatus Saccharibacteria bacterium]|nr:phosphocholine cytidylyltransferase family protein [Candidatus Saccharibacteria bacterium]MBR3253425.1 phosphocholine cytidylyltransferase family protein [Candidatus Saccharibacteria bacterium]
MRKEEFEQLVDIVNSGQADAETLEKLKPYEAKRAIYLAAGLGSRLSPITINTPKPLVRVNGKRIIETSIDACLQAGIQEIYIVTGHLADEFEVLLKKYPMIKFIFNPDYNKANNIGSVIVSSHLLENAYVLEADLLINNPTIIRKYHYHSDVLGIWKEESDDWCLVPDDDGFVAEETLGNAECYQMVGIYYWNQQDGKKLQKDIQDAFDNLSNGRDKYWETIPNQVHQGEYKIEIIPCSQTDVIEIDTLEELRQIDTSYIYRRA